MAARLSALLPRSAALVLIWLLAAASYTFAAGGGSTPPSPSAQPATQKPDVLVVPDVRRQPYVFAKGILQDAGFSWRVLGEVKGYAANTVEAQQPAPGTRLVDTGAPLVVVRLARNRQYAERGLPENESSYRGTRVVLLSDWKEAQRKAAAEAEKEAASETAPVETTPAETTPLEPPPTTTAPEPAPEPAPEQDYRKPDFEVAGAPREPADEMSLPARARHLAHRVDAANKVSRRLVRFWLYQHAWIVTGARFGWKDGDDALRILIRVDERLQRRFDFGRKSERVARQALAEVLSKKG